MEVGVFVGFAVGLDEGLMVGFLVGLFDGIAPYTELVNNSKFKI